MCGSALFALTVPVACGSDDPSPDGSGNAAAVAGEGGTKASGGSGNATAAAAGEGGASAAGGSANAAAAAAGEGGTSASAGSANGIAGDAGGSETDGGAAGSGAGGRGEAGAGAGQAGIGSGGESGAGGAPVLTNIVGDGWGTTQRTPGPDKLFDRRDVRWLPISQTGWVQYEFIVKPASIQSYGMISGADMPTRDPRSWVLLGNDAGPDADESSDSEWTVLDTRSAQGPFAARSTLYTFNATTAGSFKFYRLKVTGNNGAGETQLVELELYATPGVNAIDGIHATGFPLYAEGPQMVFDQNPDTKFFSNNTDFWLQYELRAVTKRVEAYAIVTANDVPERDPRSWTLLANDTGADADDFSDSEWTVLDTQTNQGPFPERKQRYTYAIANPGAYKFYRLKVASSNGPAAQLSELELLAPQ